MASIGRRTRTKTIVNPIFAECSKLCLDPFWSNIFLRCAQGRFPRGVSYQNGFIISKKRNKIESVEVPETVEDAYKTCIGFFRNVTGLASGKEGKRSLVKLVEHRKALELKSDTQWSQVKAKGTKNRLIREYTAKLVEGLGLPRESLHELQATINIGLCLNVIKTGDIHMENGEIASVDNVLYDEENKKFYLDLTKLKPVKVELDCGCRDDKKSLQDIWGKYIDLICKRKEQILCEKKNISIASNERPESISDSDSS